jgi:thiamine pyrophosphokinase
VAKNSDSTAMIPFIQNFKTIILANGAFPTHPIPLSFLRQAERIICCDGATENLLHFGLQPDYIVGDLDSLSETLKKQFASILYPFAEQETNDLTKSVQFCIKHNWTELTILGATGKREDHTLGNLALLADYAGQIKVQLLTDHGVFVSQSETNTYESYSGQQISIFSISSESFFTFRNLVYPVENKQLNSWWQGTLNEATGQHFTIEMNGGKALIFREYPENIRYKIMNK